MDKHQLERRIYLIGRVARAAAELGYFACHEADSPAAFILEFTLILSCFNTRQPGYRLGRLGDIVAEFY